MKSRMSGYSSDSEQTKQQDLSILRKPICTALVGFLEAKRAYDNGTEEIRRLLSRECDIMYECRVCRNVFRSLTNFISHKRVYCRTGFNKLNHPNFHSDGFIDQDISTIIQAEQDYVHKSTTKDIKSGENSNKDLSSIIERLIKREQTNRLLKLTDFYEQVSSKLTQDEVLRKKHVLQLDRVPNTDIAVYQTVKQNEQDNMKQEVNEIHDLLMKDKTVLGPDGKAMDAKQNLSATSTVDVSVQQLGSNVNSEEVICNICNLTFSTEKTLKIHIQSKHITSTYVYQCPSCSQTFMQPGAVIRHLSNDHKKSMRRIRLMRESIFKKRIRADEVQVKGPSRELARLQTDKEKRDAENKAWIDNVDSNSNMPMCTYCGKTFERKAVLTTHLNSCTMKNKTIVTRKSGEMSNLTKVEDKKNAKIEQNDVEITVKESTKTNLDLNMGEQDNFDKIDLTLDDSSSKRKRKKAPKILLKNDEVDSETLNDLFWNFEHTEQLSLKTVSLDNLEKTDSNDNQSDKIEPTYSNLAKCSKDLSFFCKICEKRFDALSNLRRHISMFHYRRRKFGCKLCEYRAFRKYDVINHLGSVHSLSGDREVVLEFIVVHEDKDKCEDVDDDIIISENGSLNGEQQSSQIILEKRGRRSRANRALKQSADIEIGATKSQTKFTRSSSNLSLSSNEELIATSTSRRPIRNRIKPVNKDFVYDLSNLLKKDMIFCDRDFSNTLPPAKTQKRRSTIFNSDENSKEDVTINASNENIEETKTYQGNARGAALAMAQKAVSCFKACFNKPPEIPTERPIIPSRLIVQTRSEDSSSTVQLSTTAKSNEQSNRRTQLRRVSDDSVIRALSKKRKLDIDTTFSEVLTKRGEMNGEKKPPPTSTSDINGIEDCEKIMVKCPTEKEFQEYLIANKLTEPVKKVNLTSYVDPATQEAAASSTKRITLMQRLAENKHRKLQESLLRSALEN